MEKKKIADYFSAWEGWYCEVEDEDGNSCGEVIGCDTGDLQRHLRDAHNIKAELK